MNTNTYDVYEYDDPVEYAFDMLCAGNFLCYEEAYTFWMTKHHYRHTIHAELSEGEKIQLIFIGILLIPAIIITLSVLL